jgi:putative Mn2+ efflux pump MntP
VGFSLAALNISVLLPAVVIGIVCEHARLLAFLLVHEIGAAVGTWAERFGGVILISASG